MTASEPWGFIVFVPQFPDFLSDKPPPAQRLIATAEVNGQFMAVAVTIARTDFVQEPACVYKIQHFHGVCPRCC